MIRDAQNANFLEPMKKGEIRKLLLLLRGKKKKHIYIYIQIHFVYVHIYLYICTHYLITLDPNKTTLYKSAV